MSPATLTVPVEMRILIILLFWFVVDEFMVNVTPPPTVSVPAPTLRSNVAPAFGEFRKTLPLTLSELVADARTMSLLFLLLTGPNVSLAQAAEKPAGIVTVKLPLSSPTKTVSPATGNEAPDAPDVLIAHVEFEFQFPLATAYRVAAFRFEPNPNATMIAAKEAIIFPQQLRRGIGRLLFISPLMIVFILFVRDRKIIDKLSSFRFNNLPWFFRVQI
jgi:hypothetical protein